MTRPKFSSALPGGWTVVVGEIDVRHAQIEGGEHPLANRGERHVMAEALPQAQ